MWGRGRYFLCEVYWMLWMMSFRLKQLSKPRGCWVEWRDAVWYFPSGFSRIETCIYELTFLQKKIYTSYSMNRWGGRKGAISSWINLSMFRYMFHRILRKIYFIDEKINTVKPHHKSPGIPCTVRHRLRKLKGRVVDGIEYPLQSIEHSSGGGNSVKKCDI